MKISLPFNIIPVLEGTGIADCFKLKAREGKTLVDLGTGEEEEFLAVLKELEAELKYRVSHKTAQFSRSPLPAARRNALKEHAALLGEARVLIEKARQREKSARSSRPPA